MAPIIPDHLGDGFALSRHYDWQNEPCWYNALDPERRFAIVMHCERFARPGCWLSPKEQDFVKLEMMACKSWDT